MDQPRSVYSLKIEPRPILNDISAVIPTLGRPVLEQSLYWIAAGTAWPRDLIVVDQGSNAKAEEWIQYLQSLSFHAKHYPTKTKGRSAAINLGLKQVTTRFVAITDDDCFVDADWLTNMAARLRQYGDAVLTGRVETAGEDIVSRISSENPAIYLRPGLKFDPMSGGNMGTSLAVVARAGPFDEDPCLKNAEDAEWSYRVLRRGVPIVYSPDVCVRHVGWRDLANRLLQYTNYARSHGGFYGKYIRNGDLFIVARATVHHVRAFRRWIMGKAKGNSESELLGKSYFFNLIPGIIDGCRSPYRIIDPNE